jgi:tetratricopeptide (TPR) repeat protein
MHPCRVSLRKVIMKKIIIALLGASLSSLACAQAKELRITNENAIIEKLGPRVPKPATQAKAASAEDLVPAVRQTIRLARQTADPRYLGQAQAMIGSLWSNPAASYDIATLQATIEQSRHEFAQARLTLQAALAKPAATYAQAWLTLATIERVQGNYKQAEAACKNIKPTEAQLYAQVCLLETRSLQGQWLPAREGFNALLRQQNQPSQQAWLLSLLAENEERAGNTAAALKHYALSLSLDNDGYTALAYADALLRQNQAAQAIAALQNQPASDAVLIRRAQGYKLLKDPQFARLADELNARFTAASQRDGNNLGHAREQALHALYVQGQAQTALAFAQSNLKLQREPIDWLIAIQSAAQLGQTAEKAKLIAAAAQTGLKDERLK